MVGFHGGVRASAVPNAPSVFPHRPRAQTVLRPTLDERERESMTRAESHDGTSGEPVGTPAIGCRLPASDGAMADGR